MNPLEIQAAVSRLRSLGYIASITDGPPFTVTATNGEHYYHAISNDLEGAIKNILEQCGIAGEVRDTQS